MKAKLKKAWARRPRLTRGQKAAVNLLCIMGMLALFWGLSDYPLPTAEMEFRRMERQNLLPKSEIFFCSVDWEEELTDGRSIFFYNTWVVGADETTVRAMYRNDRRGLLYCFPRGEGADPVPLQGGNLAVVSTYEAGEGHFAQEVDRCNALLMLDIPTATARARLEMDFFYRGELCRIRSDGVKTGNRVWMFGLETPDGGYSGDWYQGEDYTLCCYGSDGSLLLQQRGTVPQEI